MVIENIEDNVCKDLTDTHAHLSYLAKDGIEISAYLDELFKGGFGFILDIGTDPGDLAGRLKLLGGYEQVRFACGIWPYAKVLACRAEKTALIEKEIDAAPPGLIAAIGECGFDRRENPAAPREERELLELQLDLARRRNLPIIIHSRDAPAETLAALEDFPDVRGVIHCFSYTRSEAKTFLDRGYFISFAGNLTYKNAQNLRDTLPFIPDDRLLLETDCPFLAPAPHRGKPCHPAMIIETYKTAAALRHTSLDAIKALAAGNAKTLFFRERPT